MDTAQSPVASVSYAKRSEVLKVRISPLLRRQLEGWAEEDGQSLSGLIRSILHRAARNRKRRSG